MLVILALLLSGLLLDLQLWGALASLTLLSTSLALLLVGVFMWRQGVRYGSYYTLAWSVLLTAFAIVTAGSLGFELLGLYVATTIKLGVTIELITLSIGLANYLMVLEGLWLKTGKQVYLDLFHYWIKIFAIGLVKHQYAISG